MMSESIGKIVHIREASEWIACMLGVILSSTPAISCTLTSPLAQKQKDRSNRSPCSRSNNSSDDTVTHCPPGSQYPLKLSQVDPEGKVTPPMGLPMANDEMHVVPFVLDRIYSAKREERRVNN
jgi:hypothetical protein